MPVSGDVNHVSSPFVYSGPSLAVNSLLLILPHLNGAIAFLIRGRCCQRCSFRSKDTRSTGPASATNFVMCSPA